MNHKTTPVELYGKDGVYECLWLIDNVKPIRNLEVNYFQTKKIHENDSKRHILIHYEFKIEILGSYYKMAQKTLLSLFKHVHIKILILL